MMAETTKRFIIDDLVNTLGQSMMRIGARPRTSEDGKEEQEDTRPQRIVEARLSHHFCNYLYASEARRGLFRMSASGLIWVFNGKWYDKLENAKQIKDIIKRTLERSGASSVYCECTPDFIFKNCMDGIETDMAYQFQPDRKRLVFRNGILDVPTRKFKQFAVKTKEMIDEFGDYEAECMIRQQNDWARRITTDIVFDFDYAPEAKSMLWSQKLVEILPSGDMRDALQQFCGMMLANRDEIKFEYAAFVIGPGSNGKSVITSAIANVFGSEHFSKFDPTQLLKSNDKMFNMAALEGMIANFTDDLSRDDISGGAFKRFVSGEEFEARHPYGHKVFKVKAPLMLICTNELPSSTDDTWGHHRRILPILSTDKILSESEKDPMLTKKLSSTECKQAIFNWIYDGYQRVVAQKGQIELGQLVKEAQQYAIDMSNTARRWIRQRCYVAVRTDSARPEDWKPLKTLYEEYKQYCIEYGGTIKNSTSVSKIFKEKGFASRHTRDGVQYAIRVDESLLLDAENEYADGHNATPTAWEQFGFDKNDCPF